MTGDRSRDNESSSPLPGQTSSERGHEGCGGGCGSLTKKSMAPCAEPENEIGDVGGGGPLSLQKCGHPRPFRPRRTTVQRRGSNTSEREEDSDSGYSDLEGEAPRAKCQREVEGSMMTKNITPKREAEKKNISVADVDGERRNDRSGKDKGKSANKFHDLLGEAQHYLALSTMVYMYAQLREMAVLGYTQTTFREIDVNSYLPWTPDDDGSSDSDNPDGGEDAESAGGFSRGSSRNLRRPPLSIAGSVRVLKSQPSVRGTPSATVGLLQMGNICEQSATTSGEGAAAVTPLPPALTRCASAPLTSLSRCSSLDASLRSARSKAALSRSRSKYSAVANGGSVGGAGDEDESMVSSEFPSYLLNTMNAPSIVRIILTELEREQEFEEDYFGSQHDVSVVNEFRKWVDDSKADQLEEAAEKVILELRKKVAKSRWKRGISAVMLSVRLGRKHIRSSGHNLSDSERSLGDSEGNHGGSEHSNSIDDLTTSRRSSIRSSIRSSLNKRQSMLRNTNSVRMGDWFALQRRLVEDHFGISSSLDDVLMADGTALEPNTTEAARESQEMTDMVVNKRMIETVLDEKLSSYFKKRSVLSRMIDSGVEVAWFGDRHRNEAIYCICICRDTRTVKVVFRGSVTAHNWLHNMKVVMSEQPNPVSGEEYEGRTDTVRLHTGFGLYLLRHRRDDSQSKFDEICHKIHSIGMDLSPDGRYRVAVAGHSLGGALATIFSFYAAADRRFSKIEPVRVFTFAAPRVGDRGFALAYRHLERTGRVLHARLANCRDVVPLVPMVAFHGMRVGPRYEHVGLQVKLHEVNMLGKYRMRNAMDVTHPAAAEGCWRAKFRMAWKNNLISNLNTIRGYGQAHILSTHQKRLNFARQYRIGLAQSEFFCDEHRKYLKSLEEYYQIKAGIPFAEGHICSNSKSRGKTRVVAFVSASVVVFVLLLATNSGYTPVSWTTGTGLINVAFPIALSFRDQGPATQKDDKSQFDCGNENSALSVLQMEEGISLQTADIVARTEMGEGCSLVSEKEDCDEKRIGAPEVTPNNTSGAAPMQAKKAGVRIWGSPSSPAFLGSAMQTCQAPFGLPPCAVEVAARRFDEMVDARARELWNDLSFFHAVKEQGLLEKRMERVLKA